MELDQLMFDSGMTDWFNSPDESFTALKSSAGKLASLVAAAERERAAKVCEGFADRTATRDSFGSASKRGHNLACANLAAAIRALD